MTKKIPMTLAESIHAILFFIKTCIQFMAESAIGFAENGQVAGQLIFIDKPAVHEKLIGMGKPHGSCADVIQQPRSFRVAFARGILFPDANSNIPTLSSSTFAPGDGGRRPRICPEAFRSERTLTQDP